MNSGASSTLNIVDVLVPTAPSIVGTQTFTNARPQGLYVQGRYAYVALPGTFTFQVVDVLIPTAPAPAGSITIGTSQPFNVYVQGRYAYVATLTNGNNNISIIDVSSPAALVNVGTINVGVNQAVDVFVQGRFLYTIVANSGSGTPQLQVYDLGGAYIQQFEAGGILVPYNAGEHDG